MRAAQRDIDRIDRRSIDVRGDRSEGERVEPIVNYCTRFAAEHVYFLFFVGLGLCTNAYLPHAPAHTLSWGDILIV